MPPKKPAKAAPKEVLDPLVLPKHAESSPQANAPVEDALLTPHQPSTERPLSLDADPIQPSLHDRLSALKVNGLKDEAGKSTADNAAAVHSPLPVSSPSQQDVDPDADPATEEEEDGYLSDDPDEEADPESLSIVAAKLKFTLTLLIPFRHEAEVPRTADSVAAHLDDWKEVLSAEALTTTKYQKLTPAYLSKTRYGRLQVVFTSEDDAYFVKQRKIEHVTLKGEVLELRWQFPEDSTYIHLRALHPEAIEVVLKSVPAEVTSDIIASLLAEVKLIKRGKTAYKEALGFHRVQDPVTGLDTDKDACDKAHGSSFELAAAHAASIRHKTNRNKAGAATRASKGALAAAALKKEFFK
ncbi:unnamed protein product [Closterium sp. Naga37s-1]|nr:unnamed protein product [Closterium sp. Naga37s-1]